VIPFLEDGQDVQDSEACPAVVLTPCKPAASVCSCPVQRQTLQQVQSFVRRQNIHWLWE